MGAIFARRFVRGIASRPRLPTRRFGRRRIGLDPEDVLSWTDEDYRRELKGSAMKRVKLPMLKRNARIVAGNIKKIKAKREFHRAPPPSD